jgi:uncharacterized membrane protein YfcA
MFLPNSIVGWIMHARQGTASPRLSVTLNLGALPGAIAGAVLALLLDASVLSVVYAAFCLFVAVRELVRMPRAARPAAVAPAAPAETFPQGAGSGT